MTCASCTCCAQVFSSGGEAEALDCIEALLRYVLPSELFAWITVQLGKDFVHLHNTDSDRTPEEAFGYCLKDMPEQLQPSNQAMLPTAEKGRYYPGAAFYWLSSNMDLERVRCSSMPSKPQ